MSSLPSILYLIFNISIFLFLLFFIYIIFLSFLSSIISSMTLGCKDIVIIKSESVAAKTQFLFIKFRLMLSDSPSFQVRYNEKLYLEVEL